MKKIGVLMVLILAVQILGDSAPGYKNCIGLWRMNEAYWDGSANEVIDNSGQGNHGTAAGDANTTSGKIDQCGTFDGVHDSVDIPDQNLTTSWSISIWAYSLNNGETANRMVFGNSNDGDNFFYLQHGVRARFENDAGSNVDWTSDVNFYQTWRHVVLVATDTTVELYLDGVSQGVQSIAPTFKLYTIGSGYPTDVYSFSGKLDIMAVWDGEQLSQEKINWLYNDDNGKEHLRAARPLVGEGKGLVQ